VTSMEDVDSTAVGAAVAAVKTGESLNYKEMRAVAQEIFILERKSRRIRAFGLICSSLVLGSLVLLGAMALLYQGMKETEVQDDGHSNLVLTKKGSQDIIATTQSLEDLDGSDLVDYARTGSDTNGEPDGEWTLSDAKLSRIRTISWREDDTTYIHHVASIVRYNGKDTRVELKTKALHMIRIWDDTADDATGAADNFAIEIKTWNPTTNSYSAWTEVNADGDEDGGRGRVLVNLRRSKMDDPIRPINYKDYF